MSPLEGPDQAHPETPNYAGYGTFEARMRARRVATCVQRTRNLIDCGQFEEAREAVNELNVLAPGASEIAELERRISQPTPEPVFLSADPVPVESADSVPVESSREWPGVLIAVAVVLAVFFLGGYGVVKFLHSSYVLELISRGEVPSVPDAAPESSKATLAPADESATVGQVEPPRPASAVRDEQPGDELAAAARSAAIRFTGRTEPIHEPSQTDRRVAPPADRPVALRADRPDPPPAAPTSGVGQALPASSPAVTSERQPPAPSAPTAIAEVKPLVDARPVEAVALAMTGPTPTAATGAQPMSMPDPTLPPPASAPAPGGASRYDESLLIRAVLLRFENAYNRLDAKAAREVWSGVNEPALNRAFSGLISQRVSLGVCDITVFERIGGASCAGKARWEPRVGGGLQTADRYWTFQLTKSDEGWQIKEVLVR